MSDEIQKPEVCVGVMIFKNGKVLIGRRKSTSSHGKGEYSFPGGGLDYMESFEEGAKRETLEESGIKIKNIRFQCLINIDIYKPKHIILITLTADWVKGEPQTFPDERIGDWNWCDLNNLPEPLFYPTKLLIDSYKSGKNYYDKE